MTQEECLKELERWESLPLERLAYLMGYAKALDPLHRPPEECWQRVLPEYERLNRRFSEGVHDALGQILFPHMIEAGVDPERIRQAMKSLEGTDFLMWAHVQLNSELAERFPKRMARIAARLGPRAEARAAHQRYTPKEGIMENLVIFAAWLICGLLVAYLAWKESRQIGKSIAPLWYVGLIALGPATILAVLLAGETESIIEEIM